ncbi:integrase core domain-containing protein [Flavobacterium columnare]|uniref:integrase core domain-containing protein n=1 Tax=Flavobacterium columnare TaxID=996 RepID=UPI000D1AFE3E|nr:hypothetical protein C6N29_03010 [Flavobacterium columnare]
MVIKNIFFKQAVAYKTVACGYICGFYRIAKLYGWSWYKNTSRNGNIFKKFKPKCGLRFSYQILLLFQCLNRYSFSSILSLYRCIDEYINWYNTERLHSSLGYKTPLEMEIYLKNLNQNVA